MPGLVAFTLTLNLTQPERDGLGVVCALFYRALGLLSTGTPLADGTKPVHGFVMASGYRKNVLNEAIVHRKNPVAVTIHQSDVWLCPTIHQ